MSLPSSNRVVKDLTFQEDAYNTLPYDQRLKTNLVKIMLTLTNRWNDLQLLCIDLINGTMLEKAFGPQLDGIAKRLNIQRGNATDEQLRGLIKLHAVKQTNTGTRDEIVNILRLLSGTDYVKIVKRPNNYVEVTFSYECLDPSTSKKEIQDLFPINTNLVVMNKVTGFNPMSFSLSTKPHPDKIGKFTISTKSVTEKYKNNVMPVTVIDLEAGIL
ncbi:MAG: hypothetical protein EX285_03490 [Thaumarchaeota archaeon]|nr:hypothetical protein [Nitrososphaerota archaeon]